MGADIGVDRDVFAVWLAWLDRGEVDAVKRDLRQLLGDTAPAGTGAPDRPVSVDPPIHTR